MAFVIFRPMSGTLQSLFVLVSFSISVWVVEVVDVWDSTFNGVIVVVGVVSIGTQTKGSSLKSSMKDYCCLFILYLNWCWDFCVIFCNCCIKYMICWFHFTTDWFIFFKWTNVDFLHYAHLMGTVELHCVVFQFTCQLLLPAEKNILLFWQNLLSPTTNLLIISHSWFTVWEMQ